MNKSRVRDAVSSVTVVLLVVALFFASGVYLARSASAISVITNTMRITPQAFYEVRDVTLRTSVEYGWMWEPNPYTSNYMINIQRQQFQKPVRTSTNLSTNPNWVARANDTDIGGAPSWRIQWGSMWIFPTTKRHWHGYMRTLVPVTGCNVGPNRLGQYGFWDSHGAPHYLDTFACAPGTPPIIIHP